MRPMSVRVQLPLDPFCSACSATIRLVFSLSLHRPACRFSASVFGRGEYLNENML